MLFLHKQQKVSNYIPPPCPHYAKCLPTFRVTFLQRTILGEPWLCYKGSTQDRYPFLSPMASPLRLHLVLVMDVGHSTPLPFLNMWVNTAWASDPIISPSHSGWSRDGISPKPRPVTLIVRLQTESKPLIYVHLKPAAPSFPWFG